MSDNIFYPAIEPVSIKDGTGLLGAGTNGSMPAIATGLFVESEIMLDQPEFGVMENYWVKVCTTPERSRNQDQTNEYLMYSSDVGDVERLLGAVVEACVDGRGTVLPGRYDAYRNDAQIKYNPDLSEDCVEDLTCVVEARGGGGFEVIFSDTNKVVVARLGGVLEPEVTLALQAGFEKFRSERDKALQQIRLAVEDAVEAPAPSM